MTLQILVHDENDETRYYKILKPQAGHKKVPSYAVESSKHPLNLVGLSF
jgi:hypothetical protein